MKLEGRCHCGQVHYALDWPDDVPEIPARRCGCTFCTRFRGKWTSHPDASLEIFSDQKHSSYRFDTKTADFLFCQVCGVVVAAVSEIEGEIKAVLNIATLDDYQSLNFALSDSDFDGETTGQRLDRRSSRWIGNVIIQ